MKMLIAIANYGTKNLNYARRIIAEYRSMSFETDIVVLCELPKDMGVDVSELVGLPTSDPWSLPFGHRKLFIDHIDQYDLFIYTEDDILITERNIHAFLKAVDVMPENMLPGFIRYEQDSCGKRSYPDIHDHYHWIPGSVVRYGTYEFAQFSNLHSACYVLTNKQLKRAIQSGGYATNPHEGRYDLLCTAATDPYTQCGFVRVICISHLNDFEIHHLSNAYLNRMGLGEGEHCLQVKALREILDGKLDNRELFVTDKLIPSPIWNKAYYEPYRQDLVERIPPAATKILSVGAGSGETEARLISTGKGVTALPLDAVMGRLCEHRGVRVLPADFTSALKVIRNEQFDAILLPDILQHLEKPEHILDQLRMRLRPRGLMIGSVPNLGIVRRSCARSRRKNQKWIGLGRFVRTRLHLTSTYSTRKWLRASGLRPLSIVLEGPRPQIFARLGEMNISLLNTVIAPNIVFVAERDPRAGGDRPVGATRGEGSHVSREHPLTSPKAGVRPEP